MSKLFELLKLFPEYVDEAIAIGAVLAEFKTATTNHERAKIVAKAVKIIAGETDTPIDDDLVEVVEAVLNCPEVIAAVEKLKADITAKLAA